MSETRRSVDVRDIQIAFNNALDAAKQAFNTLLSTAKENIAELAKENKSLSDRIAALEKPANKPETGSTNGEPLQ